MRSGYVSLVGRPNVGKSTLLNKLIKEKLAIVSDKSGTTREQIKGITNIGDTQYIFMDTPGINKPKNLLGEYMTTVSLNTLEESDVILFILDGKKEIANGDTFIYENIKKVNTPFVIVVNKSDKMSDSDIESKKKEIESKFENYDDILFLSSEYSIGVHRIYDITKKYFTNDVWFYPEDYYTDMPVNRIVIEVIREKILLNTRDEIPHSVVVEITDVKTTPSIRHYDVTIYVERTSQKGIIIGENGSLLKKIGIQSRREIESLIDKKVNLRLWVKTRKNWRKDKKFIEEMGYKI